MKIDTTLKEDFTNFIQERIEASYKTVCKKNEYKKQYNKCKYLENKFINELKENTLKNNYYNFRDIKMGLNTQELKEAYLTGFRDSTTIHNNKNI